MVAPEEKPINLHGLGTFHKLVDELMDTKDAKLMGTLFDDDVDFNCGNWDDPEEDGLSAKYVAVLDCGSWDSDDFTDVDISISGTGDTITDIDQIGKVITVTKGNVKNSFDFDNLVNYIGYTLTYSDNKSTGVTTEILKLTSTGDEFARRVTTRNDNGYVMVITCPTYGINTKMTYVKDANGDFTITIDENK